MYFIGLNGGVVSPVALDVSSFEAKKQHMYFGEYKVHNDVYYTTDIEKLMTTLYTVYQQVKKKSIARIYEVHRQYLKGYTMTNQLGSLGRQ